MSRVFLEHTRSRPPLPGSGYRTTLMLFGLLVPQGDKRIERVLANSFVAQSHHGIDAHGAPRRQVSGQQRHCRKYGNR